LQYSDYTSQRADQGQPFNNSLYIMYKTTPKQNVNINFIPIE